MTRTVKVLERVTRVAPLGFQLWDVATQAPAGRGFVVTARAGSRSRSVRALQNASGAHVVRGLAGLHDVESADAAAGFWASPPAVASAVVDVADPDGRYLPVSFGADVPHLGLFEPACGFTGSPAWEAVEAPVGSPAARRPVVPLFSAPTREPPAGIAVVRADLRIAGSGAPASWALLQVTAPGRPSALGVADGEGRATVMFAYPEPPGLTLSPPGPGTLPLAEQRWTVGIRAYFGVGSPEPEPVAAPDGVPDLCLLLAQLEATPLADATSTLQTVQLRYGRELHVKTSGHSWLLLAPSVSSP